jgi:hypothetical protein
MIDIPFHRYADVFPLMQGAEFDTMLEDVLWRGIKNKIKRDDGQILDGRSR